MFRNPATDLIVVLVIVLLIFGPKRLPGLGKGARPGDARVQGRDHRRVQGRGRDDRIAPSIDADAAAERRARATLRRSRPPRSVATPSRRRRRAARRSERAALAPADPAMAKALRPDRPRGSAEHRRPSRRAALAADRLRRSRSASPSAFCFWQNHALLNVLNRAAAASSRPPPTTSAGLTSDSVKAVAGPRPGCGRGVRQLRGSAEHRPLQQRALLSALRRRARRRPPRRCPQSPPQERADHDRRRRAVHDDADRRCYFALLFSLPVLLYQAYAFVIPALSAEERRVAMPS